MDNSSLSVTLVEECSEVLADLNRAKASVKRFQNLVHESCLIQDEVKAISMRGQRTIKEIKRALKQVDDEKVRSSLQKQLRDAESSLDALREIRPETRSLFSRLFLGRVNVKMYSMRERERLRDEYNKFRLRTGLIFLFFPVVVLFFHYYLRHQWKDTHWINIFHQLWLLYYYTSLALRENILLVNGSNIRWWWIRHHYVAAFATTVFLVWPPTDIYLHFLPQFTFMALFQGVVQLMQLYYQRARDYTNRALGKSGPMDISYSETITEFPRELFILVPFLFFANSWMVYLGYSLISTFIFECDLTKHWTEFNEELQVFTSGVLALIMGFGNMITTVVTLHGKASRSWQTSGESAQATNAAPSGTLIKKKEN